MWKLIKQKSFKISTIGKEFFFPGLNFKYFYDKSLWKYLFQLTNQNQHNPLFCCVSCYHNYDKHFTRKKYYNLFREKNLFFIFREIKNYIPCTVLIIGSSSSSSKDPSESESSSLDMGSEKINIQCKYIFFFVKLISQKK